MDRRKLMQSASLIPIGFGVSGMAGGALATCTPTGIQIDPNVLVAINNAVATGCNWIPAITTVVALVNASFPAVVGATTVAESVVNQVANVLCKAAPAPTAGGKFEAKAPLKAADGTEIPVHGWVVENGKLTYV